jgi:hypothetical protein
MSRFGSQWDPREVISHELRFLSEILNRVFIVLELIKVKSDGSTISQWISVLEVDIFPPLILSR